MYRMIKSSSTVKNSKGELMVGQSIYYTSPRGVKYLVVNNGGEYEVWVEKLVPGRGGSGTRIKQFPVYDIPKHLIDAVPLERREV